MRSEKKKRVAISLPRANLAGFSLEGSQLVTHHTSAHIIDSLRL